MKFIVALFLVGVVGVVGVVVAFPQRQQSRQQQPRQQSQSPKISLVNRARSDEGDYIKILRSDVSPIDGPSFRYSYETENGIKVEKEGRSGSEGQSVMSGIYSFPLEDGSIAEVRYTADENGYHPESSLIPTSHPLPEHAIEQIRFAAEQRARGVEWDVRGFQI